MGRPGPPFNGRPGQFDSGRSAPPLNGKPAHPQPPSGNRSWSAQPGSARPGPAQSRTTRPGAAQPGSAPDGPVRPGTAQPGPTRPDRPAAPSAGRPAPPPVLRAGRPGSRPAPPPPETDDGSDALDGAGPGRHRRRAGESPDELSVSSFERAAGDTKSKETRSGRRRRKTFWKELPLLIAVALLLTFLIQTFLAKVYVIPSGSMETTLHGCTGCNNDRVLVDKITFRFSDPRPGDVVVFRGPPSWRSEVELAPPANALVRGLQQVGSLIGLAPPDEKDFVKRVIAVGGQTVACCDSRNRVMVDGKPLAEPYIYYLPEAGPARQQPFGPVTVPQGELWMMGDSRNNSSDSRAPGHGPVPLQNVIGQARLIVLPLTRFGWIAYPDPQAATVAMAVSGQSPVSGTPLALGLLGTLPLAAARRRRSRWMDEVTGFLPSRRTPPPRRRR